MDCFPTRGRPPRHASNVDASMGIDDEDEFSSFIMGDKGIEISDDGEKSSETLENITYKKRRVHLRPEKLKDDEFANWVPVNDAGFVLFSQGDEELAALNSISGTGHGDEGPGSKRKTYLSSDNPMAEFPEVRQIILDETLRRAGLGDSADDDELTCALCHTPMAPTAMVTQDNGAPPKPEWGGEFWDDTTLETIGLVYQLGHGGLPCPRPEATTRTMVVVDVTTVSKVKYKLCGCDLSTLANAFRQFLHNAWFPASATDPDTCATFSALEFFRHLSVVGNMNAYDFIRSIERKTSPLAAAGLNKVPERYKAFLRMSRQYAFLQRCRRAGRGHDKGGIVATKPGGLLVACWPCPHDRRNLPAGWRDVAPRYRFMYRLILAMDTNFKLKNRIRMNERDDPSLGPGWGPSWNLNATRSICATLTQKETRNTSGLRVSGVGGCVCARHECVRANGIGDLQKGERYANMDYILMSALAGFDLMELTVSYDIACQWRKRLAERLQKLPEDMRLDIEHILFQCGLPVWHALSHEAECTNKNSLSFKPGVAKSDGEGIEQLWAQLNACAFHTKTMGVGNRADTLEDKIDYINWSKNLNEANILRRKLLVAIPERERQVSAFKEVNKSIPPEKRAAWQKLIDTFLEDDENQPNPYILQGKDGPSETEIRVLLKKEEEAEANRGVSLLHAVSATVFLTAGLQLEDTQWRIKAEILGLTTVTADRESKIQEQRLALLAKLRPFRALQQIYTPAAMAALDAAEARRNVDASPIKAENIPLYLPSALTAQQQETGCKANLPKMEAMLREAQCWDSLGLLRTRLHAKRHVIYWCGSNNSGSQKDTTRSQTILGLLKDRIDSVGKKYNDARIALLRLEGDDFALHFKKLMEADMTLDGDVKDDETAARKKLEAVSGGQAARVPRHVKAMSKKTMSWIWAAQGALDDSEQELHESLLVEWARAKGRKNRWEEEVTMLREEMRRTLRYLDYEVKTWGTRADYTVTRTDLPSATRHGVHAYAAKQAILHQRIKNAFWTVMDVSLGTATDSVIAADAVLEEGADLNTFFTQGGLCCSLQGLYS
ncbi:hypothetical protein C8R43DRAFT_1134919 [Mycena crocata]|nr:hypothetical protein C8R43DRAFT_1134919 [Mycena crocata]